MRPAFASSFLLAMALAGPFSIAPHLARAAEEPTPLEVLGCPIDPGDDAGAAGTAAPRPGLVGRIGEFLRRDWEETVGDVRRLSAWLTGRKAASAAQVAQGEGCSLAAWQAARDKVQKIAAGIALEGRVDPPPSAGRPRFVVLLIVDGAQSDKMRALLAAGRLPRIKEHLVDRGLSCFDTVTIWPSTSVPSHTSIMTGRFPAAHGIVFPKWLDRTTRHYRDYIGLHFRMIGRDMRPGARTLFEHMAPLRTVSALEICNRGASHFLPGPPRDGSCARSAIALSHLFLWSGRVAAAFLRATRLDREASGHNSLPRLLVLTLPEVDHVTHIAELDGEVTDRVYEEMDRHVGSMATTLKELGVYEDTVLALTSDHGMGPVHTHVSVHEVLRTMGLDVLPAGRQVKLGAIGGLFDRIPGIDPERHDAIVAWGGNAETAIHLKGQTRSGTGVTASWDVRPGPAGLARYRIGQADVDIVQALLEKPGVGFALHRDADGAILVRSRAGTARIEATGRGHDRQYAYRTIGGEDPLGYAADPRVAGLARGRPATAQEWLEATARHPYPDVPVRLAEFFGDPREADLYLVAERGYDFVPRELASLKALTGRKTLCGTHGHLNREQSIVPFLIAGPGIGRGTIEAARSVDVVPTLLDAFGKGCDPSSTDGVSRLRPRSQYH